MALALRAGRRRRSGSGGSPGSREAGHGAGRRKDNESRQLRLAGSLLQPGGAKGRAVQTLDNSQVAMDNHVHGSCTGRA